MKLNKRQKKKQYKKRYGHNPPRGADGRYLFHTTYGLDLATGRDSGGITPEQMKTLQKVQTLNQEDVERIRKAFCEAGAIAAQGLADFAEAVSRAFSNLAEQFREQVVEQEEPPVVVARNLGERRKTCSRKGWKASKR